MSTIYDDDGIPMRRDRDGELVPDLPARARPHLVDRPCTPAETRAHLKRIRAMLRESQPARRHS